jgi:hypothetical protein
MFNVIWFDLIWLITLKSYDMELNELGRDGTNQNRKSKFEYALWPSHKHKLSGWNCGINKVRVCPFQSPPFPCHHFLFHSFDLALTTINHLKRSILWKSFYLYDWSGTCQPVCDFMAPIFYVLSNRQTELICERKKWGKGDIPSKYSNQAICWGDKKRK